MIHFPITAPKSAPKTPKLRPLHLSMNQTLNPSIHHTRRLSDIITDRETSRLLDAPIAITFDPSQFKIDEKSEINTQLRLFKTNFDKHRLHGSKRSNLLLGLKKELESLEQGERKKLNFMKQSENRIENLEKSIEAALVSQKEENENKEIYIHILKRMKENRVHLEMKYLKLNHSLNNQISVVFSEISRVDHSKESQSKSYYAWKQFKYIVDRDQKERSLQMNKLERGIQTAQAGVARKDEWKQRRADMLERAIIEDRSQRDERLRESLMVQRLWHNYINQRFENERQNSSIYENAYQRIKISTGLQEIGSIVGNFLTKEQTYKELMNAVKVKEAECNVYRRKIDEMQDFVTNFAIQNSEIPANLVDVKGEIHNKRKDVIELQAKKVDLQIKKIKIQTWLNRLSNKINALTNANIESTDNKTVKISEIMEKIKDQVNLILSLNRKEALETLLESRKKSLSSIINKIPKENLHASEDQNGELASTDLIGNEM
ncbi:unnamed protein product [Blepharisma stoltei]|uniref:Uncharacterized protein n=1 Tax=Blepharisma stoltei TaxID=1481888 RepID=A0AAU9J3J1_9CILI|nr:unnamed protein product [Blepharisma stoltei]